jgi:hypothetical protein
MLSPVIFFNVILSIIGSFQAFTQSFIMTQGAGQCQPVLRALPVSQCVPILQDGIRQRHGLAVVGDHHGAHFAGFPILSIWVSTRKGEGSA